MPVFKNPLSVAFGMAIQQERKKLSISDDELAENIGIKPSFFKLIENGTNNLHVNKSVALVESLECMLSFNSVSKILTAISMIEAVKRDSENSDASEELQQRTYVTGISLVLEKLSIHEPSLKDLMNHFNDSEFLDAISTSNTKEAKHLIIGNFLDVEMVNFLCHPVNHYPEKASNHYLIDKILESPTLYYDFIANTIEGFTTLPITVKHSDLWRWEEKHQQQFKEMVCLTRSTKSVVSIENLRRYHFNHLWEHQFTRARFIFLSEESPQHLEEDFKFLYKQRLEESINRECESEHLIINAQDKQKNFDKALRKIKFQCTNNDVSDLIDDEYTAIWFFTFQNSMVVGFFRYYRW